jgi:hypothetical protein
VSGRFHASISDLLRALVSGGILLSLKPSFAALKLAFRSHGWNFEQALYFSERTRQAENVLPNC